MAFALFDEDGNGDASRDEMEDACMWVSRSSTVKQTLIQSTSKRDSPGTTVN
jgi:hypothetical protein